MSKTYISPKRKSNRNKVIGLVFVLLMFFSTLGYALFAGVGPTTDNTDTSQQTGNEIQFINNRQLSQQEIGVVVARGISFVEYTYPEGCVECLGKKTLVEGFTQKNIPSIVSSVYASEKESLKMTVPNRAGNGIITELDPNSGEEELFDAFCKTEGPKTTDCLLRDL